MDNKHAYLIMVHHEFHMLKKLLTELDDERNDIYLHIDGKTRFVDEEEIRKWVNRSGLYFVTGNRIYPGTYSVVECELQMLRRAVEGKYQYYHLISGTDFPMKSQDYIHEYLNGKDMEFFPYHCDGQYDDHFTHRLKYYYPFLKYTGKEAHDGPGKKERLLRQLAQFEEKFIGLQEKFGVDRLRNQKFYRGRRWFSITHDFALYIISKARDIRKTYRLTDTPDEIFIPTLALGSQFADRVCDSEDFFAWELSYDNDPLNVNKLVAGHLDEPPAESPLISIIVPCYNVGEYLRPCVDSLIAQTYENIEILLIDDGSTDTTADIAKEYADRYDKIFYHHRTNGGLSAARNTGIELARGKYLAFVDSDDWVEEIYISHLYNVMQEGYADISVCGYIKEYENGTSAGEAVCFDRDAVISPHAAMRILGDIYPKENVLLVIACNKLYKREIFENNRFPEGKIHEDEFTTHRLIGAAGSIALTSAALYHYRIREGSITSGETKQNLRHLDYLDALQDRLEYCRSMMYGELFIYMLYTYYEGMKQLMVAYSDETFSQKKLYRYFREKASNIYFKYFSDLNGYQKKDYLKLILFPAKYRKTVIRLRKEN